MRGDGYRAYGLSLLSTFRLEGLPSASGKHDVVIRPEAVEPPPADEFRGGRHFGPFNGGVRLAWSDFATLLVQSGREIVVDLGPQCEPAWLVQCLLGPGMGTLLHQRGLLVLHASAVLMDGRAVVFIGHKGAGKSTTAAALHERGYSMLSDDIVVVDVTTPDRPQVIPGPRQIKLWPDSARVVAVAPAELSRFYSGYEKCIWSVPRDRAHRVPGPLDKIFVLSAAPSSEPESCSVRDAFSEIIRCLYAPRFTSATGVSAVHLRQCALLARTVPTIRLPRGESLSSLPRLLDVIEKEVSIRRSTTSVQANRTA